MSRKGYSAPPGFPEAALLGVMPYRRPMTVSEVMRAAALIMRLRYQGRSNYPAFKRVLDQLVDAGWLDRMVRKPRTGRPALCYRRIAALPK